MRCRAPTRSASSGRFRAPRAVCRIRGPAYAASESGRRSTRGDPAPIAPGTRLRRSAAPTCRRRSPSGLALIAANLVPLAGVLFFGWDLASVMILFWAESAVIGFYTALKMAVVGKFAAIPMVPFFVGHFGGFMAGHFLLIYSFFVRGVHATGRAPGAREALPAIFSPLWTSLAALFISHGVSFFDNFLGRREYAGTTMNALMMAPYNRIIVMQLALIFGGWVIMLLKSPVPALALLVLIKTVLDFTAHRKATRPGPVSQPLPRWHRTLVLSASRDVTGLKPCATSGGWRPQRL